MPPAVHVETKPLEENDSKLVIIVTMQYIADITMYIVTEKDQFFFSEFAPFGTLDRRLVIFTHQIN